MCGISGVFTPENITDPDIAAIERMLAIQKHRGPDNNVWEAVDKRILLGHNRLSIIDLRQQANQPMVSRDGRFSLVFNGEIYNYPELRTQLESSYPFSTSCDSEVLLYAFQHWGTDCLEKLNGMFAFAVYDSQRKELTLARDRFGVKPLHYAFDSLRGSFVFASEIKALHAYGIEKYSNSRLWANYLCFGQYNHCQQTFWNGIFSLPAGHFMVRKADNPLAPAEPKKWYDFAKNIQELKDSSEFGQRDAMAHKARYQTLLEDSIKLRFRSDVPVGFNISGGVDSSTLLGAVDHLYKNSAIEAFSFYTNDERYDEIYWVEKVIAKTNKPLTKTLLSAEEIPELFEEMSYFQDEPFGGIPTLAYAKLFHAARKKGIIVLLDGQGMDEAWAGYDYYHKDSDSLIQGVSSSSLKPEVLDPEFAHMAKKEEYDTPFADALLNKQYRDLFYTKIPRALRFNDRLSMMHSTELREPFLDYRLVEYAFAQPLENKVHQKQTKWLLRQIANKYLQDELTLAPKRPLQTPQREWLTEDLREWVESQVSQITQCAWIDKNRLQQEWNRFMNSERDNTFFLWQWISLSHLTRTESRNT